MKTNRFVRMLALCFTLAGFLVALPVVVDAQDGEGWVSGGDLKGTRSYEDYQKPGECRSCHLDIYRQWEQSMMSQAYTHKWDEVEYFELAVAHTENDPDVPAEVHEGCNGCHAPLAFLAGDVPPPPPGESRADESVSCDICHTIVAQTEDVPVNFSWVTEPGEDKQGPRTEEEAVSSPHHNMVMNPLLKTSEYCGSCHNELSPYGAWVKATQKELVAGPYGEEGVVCQDCHMTYSEGRSARMGNEHEDVAWHLFHGGHDPGKVSGVVELRLHPDVREVEPGMPVKFSLALFNQKTGHKFPTGSVEDRLLWVHVEAKDQAGNVYHLKVDEKGFEGEEYTIASDVLAYQDMAVPLDDDGFEGLPRDGGVPIGDRIFRMPYFDPQGRMTIMQWNTESFGVDYRIGPRETKTETYTWEVPFGAEPGELEVTATMYYALLVPSVADYLDVPEEGEKMVVNSHSTLVEVLP